MVLSDGGTVHVRPIRPSDAEAFRRFHGGLSAAVALLPLLLAQAPPDRRRGRALHHRRHGRPRGARRDARRRASIADARYDRWAGKDEAEVAFTVADEHQGRGLSHAPARAPGRHRPDPTASPASPPRCWRRTGPCSPCSPGRAGRSAGPSTAAIVDVVFDIVPTPDYLNTVDRREQRAESRSIARLLRPRSVAVVGASDEPSSVGRVLMQNLLSSGFAGPVYPVNPAHEQRRQHALLPEPPRRARRRRPGHRGRPAGPAGAGAGRRHRQARAGAADRHGRPARAGPTARCPSSAAS